MKIKIKLSNKSYCGIEFNNSKWHRHIKKCKICKEEHEKEKEKEITKIKNWKKECDCGCGKITIYNNKFIIGHSQRNIKQTDEHKNAKLISWLSNGNKEKLIERMKTNNPCKSERSINNMKYNNPSKKDEIKIKLSKNNAMNKIENIDKIRESKIKKYGENYGKIIYELTKKTMMIKYGEDNPAKVKEILEKRINTYCKRLSNGEYKLKNNWVCGEYIRKNNEIEWYDSSFELKKMIEYDEKNIFWTKKHKIRIPYINENKLNTYYVPDFLIEINNIKCLVETKGYLKENDKLKAYAGIQYCKNNNMNYLYYLGTPDNLNKDLSYIS